VIGTILWVAIVVVGVAWGVAARYGHTGWPGLGRVFNRIGARRTGRVVILLAWAFLGVHVFARYTIPHVG
jgi:hypothetical protein